jgi:O-antigen ligase
MSTLTQPQPAPSPDRWIALGAVICLGCGAVLTVAGAASSDLTAAIAGGLAAALGITLLVAADWLDGIAIVALSLPLPALYSTPSLRVAAAAPITMAVVFAWLLHLGATGRSPRTAGMPVRATVALAAAFVIATAFSNHPATSVRELLNFGVLLALLFAVTDMFNRDPRRVARTCTLLVALGAVCGVLGVLEFLTILPGRFPRWGTPFYRAALGFGQPNALGLFQATVLPLAVHELTVSHTRLRRALAYFALVATTLGLVSGFSRGSWLAVLFGSIALAFAGDRRFVFRVWIFAFLAAVVIDVGSGGLLRDTVQRTFGDWVIEQRAALTLAGVLMFVENPVIGVGPGGFADELDRVGAQIPQLWDYLPTPHNAYVQMAAEAGIIGLVAFVAFSAAALLVILRRARHARTDPQATFSERSLRRALLWSFATVCCAGMVVWPFSHGTGQAVMLVAAAGFARGKSA